MVKGPFNHHEGTVADELKEQEQNGNKHAICSVVNVMT